MIDKDGSASSTDKMPEAAVRLLASYKDQLRAISYERLTLERRLSAIERERIEIAAEAASSGVRWAGELAVMRETVEMLRKQIGNSTKSVEKSLSTEISHSHDGLTQSIAGLSQFNEAISGELSSLTAQGKSLAEALEASTAQNLRGLDEVVRSLGKLITDQGGQLGDRLNAAVVNSGREALDGVATLLGERSETETARWDQVSAEFLDVRKLIAQGNSGQSAERTQAHEVLLSLVRALQELQSEASLDLARIDTSVSEAREWIAGLVGALGQGHDKAVELLLERIEGLQESHKAASAGFNEEFSRLDVSVEEMQSTLLASIRESGLERNISLQKLVERIDILHRERGSSELKLESTVSSIQGEMISRHNEMLEFLRKREGQADMAQKALLSVIEDRGVVLARLDAAESRHLRESQQAELALDALRTNLLEANKHIGDLEREQQDLTLELANASVSIESKRREGQRLISRSQGLEQELQLVRRSRRFRLGSALVEACSSWRGVVAFPARLLDVLKLSEPVALGKPGSHAYDPSRLMELWKETGDEVLHHIAGQTMDPALTAMELTGFAKQIFREAPASALLAGELALSLDDAGFRRKWLAFLHFDAGNVSSAEKFLAGVGNRNDWTDAEKRKALHVEGSRRLLDALPELPARAEAPTYEPVPGRILYCVASSIPYHQSGYTLRSQGLLKALKVEGIDISCVTRPGYPYDRDDSRHVDGKSVWQVDDVSYQSVQGQGRSLAPDAALLQSAEQLYDLLHEIRPQIVHAASNQENALPALMAARRAGIPFVYEARGLWDLSADARFHGWSSSERGEIERRLELLVAENADVLLALNNAIENELASRGLMRSDAVIVPNAVDISLLTAIGEDDSITVGKESAGSIFRIGYAGSLVGYEGLDDLLEAISMLRREHHDVRALIVGEGDRLNELMAHAAALGISEEVEFVGRLPHAEALKILKQCDCVVLPRKREKVCEVVSPLKPLEAMLLGIPVIASDVGGMRDMVVDGVTGLTYPAGDIHALAKVITRLASDQELAQRISSSAFNFVVRERSWKTVAQKVIHAYTGVLGVPMLENVLLKEGNDLEGLVVRIPLARNSMTPEEKDDFDRAIEDAYRLLGGNGVQELIALQSQGKSPKFQAFCALRGARFLLDQGEVEAAVSMTEAAVSASGDRPILKGAATLMFNAGLDQRAYELVHEMEQSGDVDDSVIKLASQVRGRLALMRLATCGGNDLVSAGSPEVVVNFLHFSLPYTSVGYATRSHGLALGIKAAGVDLRTVTRLGFPQDFKPELEDAVLPESDVVDGVTYLRMFGSGRKGMSEVEYLTMAADQCELVLRKQGATIVHAASNYTTALPALIAARRLGLPFIYEIRGFWEVTRSSRDQAFEKSRKYRAMKMYEDFLVSNSDRIITITSAMKDELVKRGVSEEKISLAYNSVDVGRFHALDRDKTLADKLGIPDGMPVIGYVGSFVDYEGLDDLLLAASRLRSKGRDFRLLMVGDGAVMDSLRDLVVKLNLEDLVILTGRVPHEDVEAHYSLIDIAPFPRKPWEVCELVSPLKPFEAMAMSKPVVVSGTKALLEIVTDGNNGLVFEKGNVESLADTLDRLLLNAELRKELGERSRDWVNEHRSWSRAGLDVVAVYRKISAEKGRVDVKACSSHS